MTLEQWITVFSTAMSFVGLMFAALQIRDSTRQRRVESMQRLIDANRDLLSLGFSHPKLFDILDDKENADRQWEHRYLQLWLNHLAMVHTMIKHGGFDPDFREGLEQDMIYSIAPANMQRHWMKVSQFYPQSFQKKIFAIIAKVDGL